MNNSERISGYSAGKVIESTNRKISPSSFETSPELAEVKVIYKSKRRPSVKVGSAKEAFDVLYPLYDKDTIEYREDFYVLLLNHGNILLGWVKLSSGGTSSTVVDEKVVLPLALGTNL